MNDVFSRLITKTEEGGGVFRPEFYRPLFPEGKEALSKLLQSGRVTWCYDSIRTQIHELIKSRNPSGPLQTEDYEDRLKEILDGNNVSDYGVWVFYPWSGRLVHLLDEAEFVEVRTNRNRNKITNEEQEKLASRIVGIIGLSVGQSVAVTLAMERGCGEIRLADFDTLELSNLNRIRSGLHSLGELKVVNAAREIAEIDPFLKISIFRQGVTDSTISAFFEEGGKLDMLIEECDSLDVKISSRVRAKALRIPVLMDTSDRVMVDIERFDLEPGRPLLHGLVENLENLEISKLTGKERMEILMQLVSFASLSQRMKESMAEIGRSINTWPQLASSVIQGGGTIAEICRRILLGEEIPSGRYYFEPDTILAQEVH
jgi:molybdopterin/thiamine biosynthesis adenylyltransferase